VGVYTAISAGRQDADSPVDEDLIADLSDHGDYNYDHAMRVGTDGIAVRRAYACGTVGFDDTNPTGTSTNFSGSVVFSTDADDGDPGFLTGIVPHIQISLFENDADSHFWTPGNDILGVWTTFHNNTYTGFDWKVQFYTTATPPDEIHGYLYWEATAKVTVGE
jgi:hypothetical protein